MSGKKRIAVATVCAVLLLAAVGACLAMSFASQDRQQTSAAKTASKKKRPTIKIGVDIKEPFVYVGSDGNYTGIDADIAREACRRAGLKPKFVRISWNERDELLQNGVVDCLWCGYSKNSRADRYRWSDTYLTTTISVLAKRDSAAKTLSDLDDTQSVAVRAGSVSETTLADGSVRTAGPVQVKSYGSVEQSEAAFVKDYADCWMTYTYLLDRLDAEQPGCYRFLARDVLTIDLAVAFDRTYNGPYLDKLDSAILAMKKDGAIDKIEASYDAALPKAGGAEDGNRW